MRAAVNSGSSRAAADLTREPSRRPVIGLTRACRSQPDREQAYGPPPLVKSAAPSAQNCGTVAPAALTLKRQASPCHAA